MVRSDSQVHCSLDFTLLPHYGETGFMRRAFSFFFVLMVSLGLAALQPPTTPKAGSALRKAILDSLRAPVEKKLKQKVVFEVQKLNVVGDWAFMQGTPRQPNGKPINYKNTEFAEAIKEGAFDDGVMGLLQKSAGKWKVVEVAIGSTDYPAPYWIEQHHAPKSLLPQ